MASRKTTTKSDDSKPAKAEANKKAASASRSDAKATVSSASKTAGQEKKTAAKAGKPAVKTKGGEARAADVNLGQVFALRPRVPTSFPRARFLEARRLLEDETYETSEAATRAVVEKALELTQKPGSKRERGPRR